MQSAKVRPLVEEQGPPSPGALKGRIPLTPLQNSRAEEAGVGEAGGCEEEAPERAGPTQLHIALSCWRNGLAGAAVLGIYNTLKEQRAG